MGASPSSCPMNGCPRQDSNLRPRLRRPVLYPLSYGGKAPSLTTCLDRPGARTRGPYAQAMPRVLLVDDDPAILRLLEVNFRMEGFVVDAAAHGEDAIAAATAARPDVAILDLMLPGMDGRQILAGLRAMPATADVPVVFLSARGPDDAPLDAGHASTCRSPSTRST